MFREAAEAADAVARQQAATADIKRIGAALRERSPQVVITCARGSSDHAATYAKYAIETRIGVPVASAAPSVASVYSAALRVDGAVCIVISQSGRSPDLLATVASLKEAGAFVLALVNETSSPLAHMADEVFGLCCRSRAQRCGDQVVHRVARGPRPSLLPNGAKMIACAPTLR